MGAFTPWRACPGSQQRPPALLLPMPTCQTCGAQVTLLAEVGPNAEGPLPWVEREYTPVSSAKQWELGKCELLVKVYPGGLTLT